MLLSKVSLNKDSQPGLVWRPCFSTHCLFTMISESACPKLFRRLSFCFIGQASFSHSDIVYSTFFIWNTVVFTSLIKLRFNWFDLFVFTYSCHVVSRWSTSPIDSGLRLV